MIFLILGISLIAVLYLLSVRGRTGHPGLDSLKGWFYAHRGLHSADIPENSMAAFRAALENGYGIELDVHLMADGTLAVIHDSSLKRTAGIDRQIEELWAEDLACYPLQGTDQLIPTLPQVLSLFQGKAPLIIELKSSGDNYSALTQAACDLLAGYTGAYCLESFDPRCIRWLKKNQPHIIRGQLTENYLGRSNSVLPFFVRWLLTYQAENFLTKPDFVACKFADRKHISNVLVHKLWGIQGVTWTVTSAQDLNAALKEGWLPIFEGFRP